MVTLSCPAEELRKEVWQVCLSLHLSTGPTSIGCWWALPLSLRSIMGKVIVVTSSIHTDSQMLLSCCNCCKKLRPNRTEVDRFWRLLPRENWNSKATVSNEPGYAPGYDEVMPSIPAVACCPSVRSNQFNLVGVLGSQTCLFSTPMPVLKWFLVCSDSFVTHTLWNYVCVIWKSKSRFI